MNVRYLVIAVLVLGVLSSSTAAATAVQVDESPEDPYAGASSQGATVGAGLDGLVLDLDPEEEEEEASACRPHC